MKSNAPLSAGTPNTATALHCTTSQTTHVILVLVTKQKHQTTNKTHSTSTETGSYKIHTQICFYTKLGLHEKHKFREWMLNFWVSITVTLQWIHWWTLNWNYHIQQVESKISRNCKILARLKHHSPLVTTIIYIYNNLILPYLSYCAIICANRSKSKLQKIMWLQKKASGLLLTRTHAAPLLKKYELLKIDDLSKFQVSEFMYKFSVNLLPRVFCDYFSRGVGLANPWPAVLYRTWTSAIKPHRRGWWQLPGTRSRWCWQGWHYWRSSCEVSGTWASARRLTL